MNKKLNCYDLMVMCVQLRDVRPGEKLTPYSKNLLDKCENILKSVELSVDNHNINEMSMVAVPAPEFGIDYANDEIQHKSDLT